MFRMYAVVAPLLFALACHADDGTVTIKGDVPDLDIAALRGDSLVAEATRPLIDSSAMADYTDTAAVSAALRADSARRRAASMASAARAMPSETSSGRLGDNPITRRAQARGDSMARAAARAYASTLARETRAGADTVRGTVMVVGAAPARQAVLKDAHGAIITLSGMATSGLTALEGAEVVARGVRITPRDVVVSDYIVRAVNGVPAWDGKLDESADGLSLQLTDGSGRKHIASASAMLRSLAGARVWVSMRTGNTPTAFGIVGRR